MGSRVMDPAAGADETLDATSVLREVLALTGSLPSESVSPVDASGRVLADDVVSPVALPRFDNAAMDGFAVHASDLTAASDGAPVLLPIAGTAVAGEPIRTSLTSGSALRIATGAPMPAGGDAVVRLEDAMTPEAQASGLHAVAFRAAIAPGTNVRRAGEDTRAGQLLLPAGIPIGPGQVAAAAAAGIDRLPVHRRPVVTVIVSGDEVVGAGSPPGEAQVPDAIGPALRASLSSLGCVCAVHGPIPDDAAHASKALSAAARGCDVVITAGGISMGPRDHVRAALSAAGVSVVSVAIRPGKPFAFGRHDGSLVFGLPGNPVSALVAFEFFVRPALAVLMGRSPHERVRVGARLEEAFEQRPGRTNLVRAWLDSTRSPASVRPLAPHTAGSLGSLGRANAWMVVAAEVERLDAGAEVETWPMLP